MEQFKIKHAKNKYHEYNELKIILKNKNIKSEIEYKSIYKNLTNEFGVKAPSSPDKFFNYKYEWEGWDKFLDKHVYYTYEELKKIVNDIGIKSNKDYLKKYKELTNGSGVKAPQKPYQHYTKEWSNWYDFIPERTTKKEKNSDKYYSIDELKEIIYENKIYTVNEYWAKCKTLTNKDGIQAPFNPCIYYGEECKTWGDILYTISKKNRYYYSYDDLKDIVRKNNIKTCEDYTKRYKNFCNVNGIRAPRKPEFVYYPEQWEDWGTFLGTKSIANTKRDFLPFEVAREWARTLNLKCCGDWKRVEILPNNIPKNPNEVYKNDGWVNIYDWIGIKNNKISNGESIIMNFLDVNNIEYKYNKTIKGCKNRYNLKFDFILVNRNTCIEYDGKQHYEPIKYFGGEEHLVDTQKRDKIKDTYCLNNNIKMVRLPYWLNKEEIYQTLEKELLN